MKVWYPTTALSNQGESEIAEGESPKLTKEQQKQAALGGGAVLLVLIGAVLVLGKGAIDEAEALKMAQAYVKDPAWRQGDLLTLATHRPFSEYRAWEVAPGPEKGTFVVTARHYLVGPTKFLVDREGVRTL